MTVSVAPVAIVNASPVIVKELMAVLAVRVGWVVVVGIVTAVLGPGTSPPVQLLPVLHVVLVVPVQVAAGGPVYKLRYRSVPPLPSLAVLTTVLEA